MARTDHDVKHAGTYHCAWHDAVGRAVEQADYGSKWFHANLRARKVGHRPDHQQPLPTDGESDASIDAKGIETRWEKYTTGRTVLIENYDTSEPSQDYGANRVTVYDYSADGQLEVLTLVSSVTGEQITRWNYGATLSESGLTSNSLLRVKIYPESNDEPERLAGTEIDYAQAEPPQGEDAVGRRRVNTTRSAMLQAKYTSTSNTNTIVRESSAR